MINTVLAQQDEVASASASVKLSAAIEAGVVEKTGG